MLLLSLAAWVVGMSWASSFDKRCGLPPNFDSLPDFAREELTAIWQDYIMGTPCLKELELTDEILNVLSEFGPSLETQDQGSTKYTESPQYPSEPPRSPPYQKPTTSTNSFFSHPSPYTLESSNSFNDQSTSYSSRSTPDYRFIATSTITPVDEFYDYHDPAPTQGKVAKSLQRIGSPAFKDYGDIELLRDRKRQQIQENVGAYYRPRSPTPSYASSGGSSYTPPSYSSSSYHESSNYPSPSRYRSRAPQKKYSDYDDNQSDYADDFSVHFDTPHAPFLKDASPAVKAEFARVWASDDMPSESLRAEKVHLLAVSLLTAQQLESYNKWATHRKNALKAREQEIRRLSPRARSALRRLARSSPDAPLSSSLSPSVKEELRAFAQRIATTRKRSRARRS